MSFYASVCRTVENNIPPKEFIWPEGSKEASALKSLSRWSVKMKEISDALVANGVAGSAEVLSAAKNLHRACKAIKDSAPGRKKPRRRHYTHSYILEY